MQGPSRWLTHARRASCALVLALSACSGGSTSLVIDVRSDFVAGVEAVEVEVVVETLPGGSVSRRALNVGDDLVRGIRAAEFGPVPAGSHIVRATLKGRSGEELLSRRVAVEARGTTGVVIALTRNCRNVVCPAVGGDATATECQDGLCVPPACGGGSCSMAECSADSECTPPSSLCAEARCVEGVCLTSSRIGACEAGFICVEGSGCVSIAPLDAGPPDAGPPDAGCTGVCTPGQVESGTCGVCGTQTRVCASDCSWGSYSSCADDDARCPSTAPECVNDYCWGYRAVSQSLLSCLDMGRDYQPGMAIFGTLGEDIFGRPGATWTKENQQTSCPGASYGDAESGTIAAGGTGSFRFTYSASGCDQGVLGRWNSRFRILDTDGSSFLLAGVTDFSIYNSSCTADRASCSAARSFCPPPACSGVCSAGEVQTSNCGVCGTRSRSCRSDCSWGGYSACTDDDARCTSATAPECINDYCWGHRAVLQAALSCIDMARDYEPSMAIFGTLGEDVVGRPGATWTKQNRQTSCAGSSYADSESGTIGTGGSASYRFTYGATTCAHTILGRWQSRFRILDTDGSSFFLSGEPLITFRNSSCSVDRQSCTSAASYCPP
ncbi:MAG: hypothetical protein GXP55_10315 [Deltaproteobacteria bacterium]|nr:hypothetical protein [Deltaproteobacteria bacterium]